jgi:branched-subunit amino acid transport protein
VSVDVWALIALCAATTVIIKSVGPVAFGGRALPARAGAVIALLAPAVLAALVVVGVADHDGSIGLGEEAAGVAVGGAIALRGGSVLVCVLAAAVVTALLRLVL